MTDNASTPNDNSKSTDISEVLMELRSLKAQMSAVDSRLDSRLNSLTVQIAAVDSSLKAEIAAVDSSLKAKISAVDSRLNSRLDDLGRKVTDINDRVDMMGRKITDINDRVDMMGRRVMANETRPSIRVAAPRAYHSATEMQSVTAPVRRRIGFYGR